MNPHTATSRHPDAATRRTRAAREPQWQNDLPAPWRAAVVAPLHFRQWRDYEMPALRQIGYDEDDAPCYYRHLFRLETLRVDDMDVFYAALVYGEEVVAWRLRDQRWLVWKVVRQESDGGDSGPGRGFYSFSADMPR